LPPELGPWLEDLLAILEAAGLARRERRYWEIVADPLLPSAASLVNDLAREHPECAAELLVAGAISGIVMRASADRAITGSSRPILTPAVLDFYDSAAASRRDGGNAILRLLEDERIWPTNRALRILQIGCGPLTKSLSELQRRRNFSLAIVEPDRRRRDTAIRRLSNDVVFAAPDELRDLGSFDLIVSVEALHRLPSDVIQSDLRRAVAPRGLLLAVEQGRSAFACMMSGFDPGTSAQPDFRTRPRQPDDWVAVLAAAGFEEARSHNLKCGYPPSSLIIARAARSDPPADPGAASGTGPEQARSITVLADPTGPGRRIAMLLARILAGRGIDVFLDGTLKTSDGPNVVQFLGGAHEQGDPMARLTERCMEIKSCAERLGTTSGTIWHVHRRALASEAGEIDPIATGTWAFSRTVANEYPNLRVRRIDVAAGVPAEVVAARLADIIISGTPETDIQIAADSIRALRVARLDAALARLPVDALPALRLERGVSPKKKFAWRAFERTAPGPGEVEIAVEATGLNFRDVMWALSLLPDDILEDGLAGPTLGCECTGKILRLGPAVTGLAVGDPVAAFAASGFATHVTVPAHCVAPLPAQIGCEAGATIPVAFLTAYYSLVTLARLKRGEWVLIHGGAGGVGLAAIQIARARGAHIVASVGSAAKGDLLKALGVDHVLDSRANSFADDVRALVKAGVDVVLNSLAGEAMERGLDCLRPFGRFVEIGKRDYAANTHVGLRPFRKNLTYFGVDIDQLLARDDNIGTKIFAGLMKKFDKGTFTPLPHSVFEATDLADAFHLMQHSRHIGKIVVRRPRPEIAGAPGASFSVSPRGTHVITGGFGGLGLEAAKWLVEMGARSLALIGRSGAASQEAQDAVAEFARRGVRVYAEPCDISDRHAAEQLFDRLGRTMPPVVGVLHAAMVLDDGLIANLDRERFYRVLAPKVIGAENLDALTRDMPLDYFVLFSSATTLMGNPGQGNYVAANAYMEGLARRRRQEGLKALAVGWGPITDVGVLARSERLRSRFQKLTGVGGLRAADAIALLARALEQPQTADLAVITISSTEGPFPADRLPVLASPTYGTVVGTAQQDAERETKRLDVHQLAADKGVEAARRALADIIVAQLARILRAGEEEISAIRPLGEMGVDSLMAVEVAMNLEESFGIHLALTNSIGSLTVTGLADKIVADLGLSNSRAEISMVRSLVDRHAETVDATQMAALEQIASDAFGVQGSALA
jgi:NADPH:quinone reductase-like Zn-dependent oxidoreductase/acyl carrier protein